MKGVINSPAQRIYMLYGRYEKRGLSTKPISEAIDRVTCTVGKTNEDVVMEWLKECEIAESCGY